MRKEKYFTPDTIKNKSQEMLASVAESRRRHASIKFKPEEAALLVLDMQEYFLRETSHAFVPSATAILEGLNKLIASFTKTGKPVFFTRHQNSLKDAGMMATWWRDLIKPQAAYSQYSSFLDHHNSNEITKTQYDAFFETTLKESLNKLGVTQVIICGVMTHLCCETTARSAFMHGFKVFFTIDGTATYTEDLHRASLLTLSHGFAVPVLIEELLQTMDENES